jgi:NAD(P)-dependent dehydrogenase (short-subunit alcohol dehydrogenase family)
MSTPDLTGRVAVVTGAAGGLGRAYVGALAGAGATLAAVDERPVGDVAGAACGIVADLGDEAEVERAVGAVIGDHGGVDVLINNAGRWKRTPTDSSRQQALADYHELMDANTRSAFLAQRSTVDSMIERGGGDIVNVSTYYVLPPRPADFAGTNPVGTDLYAASKWALSGFTQAWALALRRHNIRVNAVAMGATDTPMLRALFAPDGPPDDVVATWMTPEQQAQLVLDLLAEGPDGRSGETIGSWVGAPIELPPRRRRGEDII